MKYKDLKLERHEEAYWLWQVRHKMDQPGVWNVNEAWFEVIISHLEKQGYVVINAQELIKKASKD